MAKEKWTIIYEIRKNGTPGNLYSAVNEGWTEGKVTVGTGGKTKSAAYTAEEKGGLISGVPQDCKMVVVEGEENEVWDAFKKVVGGGSANGKALHVLTSAMKETSS